MSSSVIVTGLPADVQFQKLLQTIRSLLKKIQIKAFWIRDFSHWDRGLKQITISIQSNAAARKARTYLDNFAFKHNMMEYPLQAHIIDEPSYEEAEEFVNEDDYVDWGRKRRRTPPKRRRERSRSPRFSSEASKLDMEIELLRKQRQVIEEERRLLLEQKKLEMIREYGPSASREFDDFEPPRKRRLPEPVPKRRPRSPPMAARAPKAPRPRPSKGLPNFFQPCKKLINQMSPYIEKDTTPEEVEILIKLIRATIRKKLAIALEDKGFMASLDIIKVYREMHPIEDDEAFVAKILANIRASYLTTEVKQEKEKPVKDEGIVKTEDAKPNEKENEGENKEGDQLAKEDTPANGDKETEAAANSDTVTADTDASQEPKDVPENLPEEVQTKIKTENVLNGDETVLKIPTEVKTGDPLNDNEKLEVQTKIKTENGDETVLEDPTEVKTGDALNDNDKLEVPSEIKTGDNDTVLDEAKENELLEDEPKADEWAEQWSPKNVEEAKE